MIEKTPTPVLLDDARGEPLQERPVKCVVWDADNTLWDGILVEGDTVQLRPGMKSAMRTLDERGILQSVASRSDEQLVLDQLEHFGLSTWLLFPQVHWGAKSGSIARIVELLNIGVDSILLVDDESFERAQVTSALPGVRTDDGRDIGRLLARPDLTPAVVTSDGNLRRVRYQEDVQRTAAEHDFEGSTREFLAALGLVVRLRAAASEDLARAEELTLRTNQLNSTGVVYPRDELDSFRRSSAHALLAVEAEDRFGSFGTVGLVLLEQEPSVWAIKLLLTSCRVVSRGVGTIVLDHLVERALTEQVTLRGDLVETGRNRLMKAAYHFAGFVTVSREGDRQVLELAPDAVLRTHPHVRLEASW